MTQNGVWPDELTRITGRQVRRYREATGMSAQRLADTLTAMGMPYTRTQVTNLEAKRRSTITVSEILMFAAALKVAPGLLLFPVGTDEQVPILPGVNTDAWTATKIFSGEVALTRLTGAPGDPAQRELAQ